MLAKSIPCVCVHICLHEHAIDCVSVRQYGLATMCTRAVNAAWYLIAAQISMCAVLVNITYLGENAAGWGRKTEEKNSAKEWKCEIEKRKKAQNKQN